MVNIRRIVGTHVRELRQAARLTQEQLGERAGLSYKFIGEVERGVGNPTIETLAGIATALGVTPAELMAAPDSFQASRFSVDDYAVVRDARDSLENILKRVESSRPRRRTRR